MTFVTFYFKQVVYQVYLALLLLGRGPLFQQRTDGDIATVQAAGLLGHMIPAGVGLKVRVGIGKEYDAMVAQREELVGGQFIETASCQPQILWFHLRHDYRRLLGLDYCDSRPSPSPSL